MSSFEIEDGVLKKYVGADEEVSIPDGVIKIGGWSFEGRRSLTSVSIPNSVVDIGSNAFTGCSSLESVTIPDSVVSIGDSAFSNCRSLKKVSVPDSVMHIGREAFSYTPWVQSMPEGFICAGKVVIGYTGNETEVVIPNGIRGIGDSAFQSRSKLTRITIPKGVTSIGMSAFSGCSGLTSVTIPKGVTGIGKSAFSGCSSLMSVTIPDGVMDIERGMFFGCSHLTCVTIPKSVNNIETDAFTGCSNLTSVIIPESTSDKGSSVSKACINLQVVKLLKSINIDNTDKNCFVLFESNKEKAFCLSYASKKGSDNISDFIKHGRWSVYDNELVNNGPKYKYKLNVRVAGALGRLMSPKELTEENRTAFTEIVKKNIKKIIPVAESVNYPELVDALFNLGLVDKQNEKAIRKLLASSKVPGIAALSEKEIQIGGDKEKGAKKAVNNKESSPLEIEYSRKFNAIKGEALLKNMKMSGVMIPVVYLRDGTPAPNSLFRFILVSYGSQKSGGYHFDIDADEAAQLLSRDSLSNAIDTVSGHLDGPNYPTVIPTLCRYGTAGQIKELIGLWKEWGDWSKFNRKGKTARKVFEESIILSNTREAALWLEKKNRLAEYASVRGISEAEVYERYLFDIGFDESGKKVFDLTQTKIVASLTSDMKISLFDEKKGKAVMSIPKKNIDPAVQKVAADEIADLRRNLKKLAKIKYDQLFLEYLVGEETDSEKWKAGYEHNPLLRRIASLLVWAQGDNTFIQTENGTVDCGGSRYVITDEKIRIAHPMEMNAGEIRSWQKYFASSGLKQPFSQIWEPVYSKRDILPDRYKGVAIKPFYLKNQEKRGITAEWYENEYYESKRLCIKGFEVEAQDADDWDTEEGLKLQITSIRPVKWNRRANSVIAFLDRITVYGRIKKDDMSIIKLMDAFTLEQICDFISVAIESRSVNVLASLMDYKNEHFKDFDPIDKFLLE